MVKKVKKNLGRPQITSIAVDLVGAVGTVDFAVAQSASRYALAVAARGLENVAS